METKAVSKAFAKSKIKKLKNSEPFSQNYLLFSWESLKLLLKIYVGCDKLRK